MSLPKQTRRGPSALARVLASAGVLAGGSCSLVESDDCCWLDIRPHLSQPSPGYNSSLLDSAGIAGIEIRVLGEVFVADDFKPSEDGAPTVLPRIGVGEAGSLSAWVRLVQDGSNAAVGTISWTLGDNTVWDLVVERISQPHLLILHDEERCYLEIRWCQYKRLPIVEELANYPGEALWVVLYEFPHKLPDGAVS